MAPSLEQEVNLSRRACRKLKLIINIDSSNCNHLSDNRTKNNNYFSNELKINLVGAKSSVEQDDANKMDKFEKYCGINMENCAKIIIENSGNERGNNVTSNQYNYSQNPNYKCQFQTSSSNPSNSLVKKLCKMISYNKIFIYLVLINVLLNNCGFVTARPNTKTNGLVDLSESNFLPTETQTLEKNDEIFVLSKSSDVAMPSISNDKSSESPPHAVLDDSEGSGHGEEHHKIERYPVSQIDFVRIETPFIIGVWILFASIAKIGFHMTPKINKIFPESSLLIVVGVITGIILNKITSVQVSPLTPNTFFFYMLPPIILDAGYFMPNRLFFDNIGTIILMAVIGTIFNIATIGLSLWACGLTGIFNVETPLLDIFLFASLISAVDPVAVLAVFEEIHVNEILYIVVFGESLLNDAVTVVLYHMFESYSEIGVSNILPVDIISGVASFLVVALGGTIIGVIWGFLTGLVTRFTDHVRVIEPIFIFVMAYLAYLNAEIFHMSGILAITFCGITMKNYVEANISHKSHTTIKYALKMLSSSSETIIFMFLGVATVNNNHIWNTWFVLLTVLFCSFFRVIGVIMLVAIANRFRIHKLSKVDQFVMSYGGLRGAVAFALVLLIDKDHVPLQPMFLTTTIAVIYFTVFLQGITIKPLVKILNVKRANKRKPTMNERIHERFIDHLMAGLEDIVGKTGNYNLRDKFKRFDNRFIRPYLIRDLQGAEPKILETYSKLAMKDAIDYMRRNPSTIGQMSGTESMSALFRNYTGVFGGRCAPPFVGTCPSFSNLENSTRNLDMQELDYNPSRKDLTDARIHHLLAEELKPYRRASVSHRRLSYSRHAVDDRDLSTQVNYKMHMNIRRMGGGDRKHHKRSKRQPKEGAKQNQVSFAEFKQNGSAKQFANDYINEVLHENSAEPENGQNDDWDSGLTFTAKSSPDSDGKSVNSRTNTNTNNNNTNNNSNNSLIAHITSLPGFDPTKARIVKHLSLKSCQSELNQSHQRDYSALDLLPTAAESLLPWRRDKSYQCIVDEGGDTFPEDFKRFSRDSEGEVRVATPTATESTLPWKRGDEETDEGALKQNEFPAWASNKEYLAYNSPSATFLGGISKPKQVRSVIGLFRRESTTSGGASGTDIESPVQLSNVSNPPLGRAQADRRSASITGMPTVYDDIKPGGHHGQFPVTASHRRNTRRGSLLEMSGETIPEELHSKSLPDRARKGIPLLRMSSANTPLIGTPTRAQIYQQPRIQQNPQATALLSSPSTDSDSDEEVTVNGGKRPNRNYDKNDYKQNHHDDNDDDEDDDDEGLQMRLS